MHNSIRSGALALAMAALALSAGPGLAANTQAAAGTLSPEEVTRKLETAGYTNVHDVEYDDGRYEAEATSPAGVAVDLHVDPLSGKVTHEERD